MPPSRSASARCCLFRVASSKAAIEKAGKVDKEAIVDALAGLVIPSPTGPVTIGRDHYATMNMLIAKTQGRDLVTVRALGEIAPQPGCKLP
jgi:urea transport system substrate-binding protein